MKGTSCFLVHIICIVRLLLVIRYFISQCDVQTATGVYSCLSVDMQFKRQVRIWINNNQIFPNHCCQLSYYVFTIYVPTFMTVCVSWMSFWLDHRSAPARVALVITTLLAMSTTTSDINSSLPPVAYTKVTLTNVRTTALRDFHWDLGSLGVLGHWGHCGMVWVTLIWGHFG